MIWCRSSNISAFLAVVFIGPSDEGLRQDYGRRTLGIGAVQEAREQVELKHLGDIPRDRFVRAFLQYQYVSGLY